MIDYKVISHKPDLLNKISQRMTISDFRKETNEMIDTIQELIVDCVDADVVFLPIDLEAYDPYVEDQSEANIAWTLAHVIVHLTASLEESAALAAELARGVPFHGRSRNELAWETVKTIGQCRQRLEESRRMCLASLDMWPDEPYFSIKHMPWEGMPKLDCRGYFLLGPSHAYDHLGQIRDIVRQGKEFRTNLAN